MNATHSDLLKLGISKDSARHIVLGLDLDFARQEISLAQEKDIQIIPWYSEAYPSNLKTSPYRVPLLYVKGQLTPLDQLSLACVGTRKASSYGQLICEKLLSDLWGSQLTIISGMAHGIDRLCHNHALQNQLRTIAVLGHGLLHHIDSNTKTLYHNILQNGCIISQFPLQEKPSKSTFPIRNKLISGLSLGTLILESKTRGGALITAYQCLEEGKPLMAVPGNIFSNTSSGCNKLISEGAYPISSGKEILNLLQFKLPKLRHTPPKSLPDSNIAHLPAASFDTPEQQKIFSALSEQRIQLDEVVGKTSLSLDKVLDNLIILEMKNYIHSWPGNYYSKVV